MATVRCTACGVQVDEFETYFAASGQVCGPCNTADELRDDAEFARGAEDGLSVDGALPHLPDGHLSSSSTTTEVGPDGTTRTVTRTVSVNGGLLGVLIKLFMSLFRR